jgi:integrase
MPRLKLMTSNVKRLACPPGKDQELYWDTETKGFGLRVTASGSRAYIARGYPSGHERRVTLNASITTPLDTARMEADEKRIAMQNDVNLRDEKRRKREQDQRDVALGVTLREVMEEYVLNQSTTRGGPLRESTKADIRRHVKVNLSDWADKPVSSITRDKCLAKFNQISARAPSQANQCMAVLRGLLNRARERFATDEDEYPLLPINPVSKLFKKNSIAKWNREDPRTTRIPTARIGAVWAMLQRRRSEARTVDDRTSADWVCFMMLTGTRRTESGSLRWSHVNLEEGWFHLPADVVKNHNAITLPMSATLRELLSTRKALPAVSNKVARRRSSSRPNRTESDFVFPSWGRTGYITDARATMDAVSEVAGTKINIHDFRRTFEDVAALCRVDADMKRQLINHLGHDVHGRHYANSTDPKAMTAAVEAIASWIVRQGNVAEAMLSGANVVALAG